MSFLDKFILYDRVVSSNSKGFQILIETFDYCSGNFSTCEDGRVNSKQEIIKCSSDNPDVDINIHNNNTLLK